MLNSNASSADAEAGNKTSCPWQDYGSGQVLSQYVEAIQCKWRVALVAFNSDV